MTDDDVIDHAHQAAIGTLLATAEIVTVDFVERLEVSTRAENVLINNFLGETVEKLRAAFMVPSHHIHGPKGRLPHCGKTTAAEVREALLRLPPVENFDGVTKEELVGRLWRQAKQIEALERELRLRGGRP